MTQLTSLCVGEWPTGVHWTPGETRDLDLVGATPPAWLTPAAPSVSPLEERHAPAAATPPVAAGRPRRKALRPDGSVATQDNDE